MALIVSLWVIHTHLLDEAQYSPLLAIVSLEHGTGKSTLLTVLSRLCRNAYKTAQVSPGHLLRMIGRYKPTMLFEDADAMFRGQQFLTILKSSHDRACGGITTTTKKDEFVAMPTFFAKATKSHGGLPDSLKHRSIQIQLQRRRPDESISPVVAYTPDLNDDLTALQAQVVRWAEDHRSDFKMVPLTSRRLRDDRLNDTFSPLMAIAELIGGDIPHRVEDAARKLLAHEDVKSEGARLLENIREILIKSSDSKVLSSELVESLCARSDWGWAKCNKGRTLDQVLLAAMLKPYGIVPVGMRSGGAVKRGYWIEKFQDAFERYLTDGTSDLTENSARVLSSGPD